MSDPTTLKLIGSLSNIVEVIRSKMTFIKNSMEKLVPGDVMDIQQLIRRMKLAPNLEELVAGGLSVQQLESDNIKTFFNDNVRPVIEVLRDPNWDKNFILKLSSVTGQIKKQIEEIKSMERVRSTMRGQIRSLRTRAATYRNEIDTGNREAAAVFAELNPLEEIPVKRRTDEDQTKIMVLRSRMNAKQNAVKSSEVSKLQVEREMAGKEAIVAAKTAQIVQAKEGIKQFFSNVFPYENWQRLQRLRQFIVTINAQTGDPEAIEEMEGVKSSDFDLDDEDSSPEDSKS